MDYSQIEGTIVYQGRAAAEAGETEESGKITIADHDGLRRLYFGDGVMQSCMRLDKPWALQMDYCQAMMFALVFNSRPASILMIGLGGGSLVKFLVRACPDSSLDLVEISGQVIEAAYEYFYLPKHNPQVKIFHAAGQDFLKQPPEAEQKYDLILIDVFNENGPATFLQGDEFLLLCRKQLAKDGLIVFNLWNRLKDNFSSMYETIRTAFGGSALKLLLSEVHGNAIVIAFQNASMFRNLAGYRPEARRLQQDWDINFPKYLNHLYWQNFSTIPVDDTYQPPGSG